MRALSVVLLLVIAVPAFADTPPPAAEAPPAEAPPAEAPPAEAQPAEAQPAAPPAEEPAEPITPPALTRSVVAPAAEEPPEPPPRRHNYRWQIITGDAAAIALSLAIDRVAADGGGRPGALATLTIASYFFTAPMIHGLHRQGTRALGSFALRAGLPLLLGLLGEELDGTPECDFCMDSLRSEGKLIGLTAGVLIAMAVDNVLLARPIYKRTERPRAAWTPALGGVRGGATAGVLGTF
jgi:hypothetical protein